MPLLALLSIQGINLNREEGMGLGPNKLVYRTHPILCSKQGVRQCDYLTTLRFLSSMYEEKDGGSDN